MNVYQIIATARKKNKKLFSVLIDPDKLSGKKLVSVAEACETAGADFIFVGSSLLTRDNLDSCIRAIRKKYKRPVVLFPGNTLQVSKHADAILFLSLISGRNAEMLIGNHVIAAPLLKQSGIEVMPTGYMLIESGAATSASYMSNSTPIPRDKTDIASSTAMAGELLGMKLIFMDAGSGAKEPISTGMIKAVRKRIDVPVICGGGIRSAESALDRCSAGADVIVVGNSIEKNPELIHSIAKAVHSFR
ncbi:MAG: geranylgeranylglyceryl/heptaprenylglyceryl phosphate synthase [Bacteroidia bacterium]|nr:geranylgeranylglyceryl/heptaprenylglyceryl phosphate synthase [Bacteroidia bacterium]